MSIAIRADKPQKTQPALRLVDTRGLDREDWLTVRKSGIGGSARRASRDMALAYRRTPKWWTAASIIAACAIRAYAWLSRLDLQSIGNIDRGYQKGIVAVNFVRRTWNRNLFAVFQHILDMQC